MRSDGSPIGSSMPAWLRKAPALADLPGLTAAMAGNILLRRRPLAGSGLVQPESPVIIAGMHRSGTSIVTELLERLGLFVGRPAVDEHAEWMHFTRANRAMIGEGSYLLYDYGWTAPKTDEFIAARRGYAERTARRVAALFPRHLSAGPWGWKDPRNCLTLPVWLSIFPAARVLHIVRDGRAVALSLADRDRLDPTFALELWAAYVSRAERGMALVPEDRRCIVRYEDLIAEPVDTLEQLASFAGLKPEADQAGVAGALDVSRVPARLADPRASALGDHALLRRYGYLADSPVAV